MLLAGEVVNCESVCASALIYVDDVLRQINEMFVLRKIPVFYISLVFKLCVVSLLTIIYLCIYYRVGFLLFVIGNVLF